MTAIDKGVIANPEATEESPTPPTIKEYSSNAAAPAFAYDPGGVNEATVAAEIVTKDEMEGP
eukprot:CAMPEP_0172561556 /NCGR_PEP_ID=MMETSP1067-20121228/93350_1 /TAXON_ID=265564 ORGANISM="Thalassiosira punctigera, Strain Tpunct2005C2" /NCGR_SAMPLE_ID=MMETSP1067 /ASSEMBLY_ACC=CAM_ASM_000444 /LENGTH=61 /DNA_ID=CAMNT_0013351619 /DNA_START=102 /DNA_END=284 /DNA_ORIENTATION=+